jgi:Zn-dependent peptidase ImmA (M78 family)
MGMKYKHYYDVVKSLKDQYKRYPISIRRTDMPDDFGECFFDEDKNIFVIHINSEMSEDAAVEVCMHEVAHILTWDKRVMHGNDWGKAYSKLYRLYERKFLTKKKSKHKH